MAIGNGELMRECMGTARMKQDKETDEDDKKGGVSVERSKEGIQKRSQHGHT